MHQEFQTNSSFQKFLLKFSWVDFLGYLFLFSEFNSRNIQNLTQRNQFFLKFMRNILYPVEYLNVTILTFLVINLIFLKFFYDFYLKFCSCEIIYICIFPSYIFKSILIQCKF
jgi:hypothetical protein